MFLLLSLLTTLTMAGLPGPELAASAAASTRPAECSPASGRRTVWYNARTRELDRYCADLARADARMNRDPEAALAAAESADRRVPGRAAPRVAAARALLSLAQVEASVAAFGEALARDRHSVDAPLALRALAKAYRQSNRLEEALVAYRRLVPLASLLPEDADRVQVLLEAAYTAMTEQGAKSNPNLDEATRYLRQAAREARGAARLDVALSLALTLDRAGHKDHADALLAELDGATAWQHRPAASYVIAAADNFALLGLSLERSEPKEAAVAHRRYLEGVGAAHPFAAMARARASGLERERGAPRGASHR